MSKIGATIAVLRDAYPRQDFPDRSVALYATALADLGDDELLAAVKRLIRRSAWLPSIAEIREEVAEERLALPTPDEAWALVQDEHTRRNVPPEVAAALRAVGGGYTLRSTTNPERLRREFLDTYRRTRDRAILSAQGAIPDDSIPALPGASAPVLGDAHAVVRSLAARRLQGIEETTRIKPRPTLVRLTKRWRGATLPPPSDEEKADAIEILEAGPIEGDDPLWVEAQRILDEADAA